MVEPGAHEPKSPTRPCWSWSGAEALDFTGPTHELEQLVAMLPETDDEILTFVVDLRARFQRWLHQDEFGPTRAQQTATLRTLRKSIQALHRQLAKGVSSQRVQLDAALRKVDPTALILQQIYEAASDLEGDLQISGALNREIEWASKIKVCAETALVQSQSLDTNTDGDIFLIAIQRKFDPLQTCPSNFGLPDAEQWLNAYCNVVDKTLCELNERGGAEERVSLKLLVEQLCEFWERETGRPVTAHGMTKLEYTPRTETEAGRFVTAAIEEMVPAPCWFDGHSAFSHSVRARTLLPSRQADRARHILVIMRDFVKRRSKKKDLEDAVPKKLAFNSVNAATAPSPVAMQNEDKPGPPLSRRPNVDRDQKPSSAHCGRADD